MFPNLFVLSSIEHSHISLSLSCEHLIAIHFYISRICKLTVIKAHLRCHESLTKTMHAEKPCQGQDLSLVPFNLV